MVLLVHRGLMAQAACCDGGGVVLINGRAGAMHLLSTTLSAVALLASCVTVVMSGHISSKLPYFTQWW